MLFRTQQFLDLLGLKMIFVCDFIELGSAYTTFNFSTFLTVYCWRPGNGPPKDILCFKKEREWVLPMYSSHPADNYVRSVYAAWIVDIWETSYCIANLMVTQPKGEKTGKWAISPATSKQIEIIGLYRYRSKPLVSRNHFWYAAVWESRANKRYRQNQMAMPKNKHFHWFCLILLLMQAHLIRLSI